MNTVNEKNNLKVAKNFILTTAIMSTIFAIPYIGAILGLFFQIPMITLTVIICIGLNKMRDTNCSKTGLLLALIASIISILGGVFFAFYFIVTINTYLEVRAIAAIALVIYALLGFVAWVLYIISAILLFIEVSRVNTEIRRQMYQFNSTAMMQKVSVVSPINLSSTKIIDEIQVEPKTPADIIQIENQKHGSMNVETKRNIDIEDKANPFYVPVKKSSEE